MGNVRLSNWQKCSWQKWKSELGEILKHLAFHKGTPDIHIHELSLTENRWQSCCTKYSHLEVIHKWVVSSERVIYPLKFRFYDKGSRISFLCTVTLVTRLCISLNRHVRPWRQSSYSCWTRGWGWPIGHQPCLPEKKQGYFNIQEY
jgi:hypothetical protein